MTVAARRDRSASAFRDFELAHDARTLARPLWSGVAQSECGVVGAPTTLHCRAAARGLLGQVVLLRGCRCCARVRVSGVGPSARLRVSRLQTLPLRLPQPRLPRPRILLLPLLLLMGLLLSCRLCVFPPWSMSQRYFRLDTDRLGVGTYGYVYPAWDSNGNYAS